MRAKLIPALRRLYHPVEGSSPHDPADFLYECGREREALLYALLFIPSFTEIEGIVLQTSFINEVNFPESFIRKKHEGTYPLRDLERSFNYVETSHIFNAGLMENLEDEDDLLFAECVAEAWGGRLCLLYPGRRFQVSVIGPPESGDAYAICFHEER
jgi:hypothetical protein